MQLGATIPTDILMEVCLALVSGTVVMGERSLHIAECLESAVASHTVMEVYLVLVLVTEVMATCLESAVASHTVMEVWCL